MCRLSGFAQGDVAHKFLCLDQEAEQMRKKYQGLKDCNFNLNSQVHNPIWVSDHLIYSLLYLQIGDTYTFLLKYTF